MAINKTQLHLVCYDIADPRRLGRVYRLLTSCATPIQYSVFVLSEMPAKLPVLIKDLEEIIDSREDDIRIYSLPWHLRIEKFGRARFPEGITLLQNGLDLIASDTIDRSDETRDKP